jgi:hypothetical protein
MAENLHGEDLDNLKVCMDLSPRVLIFPFLPWQEAKLKIR